MSDIVTPGGAFPQDKEIIKNMTSIATYFNHPQRFQGLKNVQENKNVPVGYPHCPGKTCVSSVHKLMTQSLLFYGSLKRFYDETKYFKEDEEFVKYSEYITEE